MGKGCKVVVCGQAAVGKTAILEQLLYGNHTVGSESNETQEDVYVASVETDRGVKEQLRLYDTKGLHDGQDLPKHYYSVADGFVLVYSVDSLESFKKVDILKKEIDKSRDKKEVWPGQSDSHSAGEQDRPAGASPGGPGGGAAVGARREGEAVGGERRRTQLPHRTLHPADQPPHAATEQVCLPSAGAQKQRHPVQRHVTL
ncbi:NF-kappa-B inhibitor-interacting Ras-like protein 1 isoform X3 [Dicentrarchus labrax]|nr:NF-kappa-B inhibitor-interacting Ras-like protein 1 isoform X3 [Dicentrarchus labrax]